MKKISSPIFWHTHVAVFAAAKPIWFPAAAAVVVVDQFGWWHCCQLFLHHHQQLPPSPPSIAVVVVGDRIAQNRVDSVACSAIARMGAIRAQTARSTRAATRSDSAHREWL